MSGSTVSVTDEAGGRDVKQKVVVAVIVTGAAAGAAYLGYRLYKHRSSSPKDDAASDIPHVYTPPSSEHSSQPIGSIQSGSGIVETDDSPLIIADDHFKQATDGARDEAAQGTKTDDSRDLHPETEVTGADGSITKPGEDSGRESNDSFETNDSDNSIVVIGHKTPSGDKSSDQEPSWDALQESTVSFDGSIISDSQAEDARREDDITKVTTQTKHDLTSEPKVEEGAAEKEASTEKQAEVKSETPASGGSTTTKDEHKQDEKPTPEKTSDSSSKPSPAPPAPVTPAPAPAVATPAPPGEKSPPPPVPPKPVMKRPPPQAEKAKDDKPKRAAEVSEADDDNGIVVIERTTQAESLKAAPPSAAAPSSTQEPISFDGSIITHEKADVAKLDWAEQCEESEEKAEKSKTSSKSEEKKESVAEKKPAEAQHSKPSHKDAPSTGGKKESKPEKGSTEKTPAPAPATAPAVPAASEGDSSQVMVMHPDYNEDEDVDFGMRVQSLCADGDIVTHRIIDVTDGAPAYKIGIMVGDVLIRLNGMGVRRWPHDVLIEQLSLGPAEEIQLTIRRSGPGISKYKEITARLRNARDGLAVTSEEMEVEESLVPAETDIVVTEVPSEDRRRACFIEFTRDGVYLAAVGRHLRAGRKSPGSNHRFAFRRELFNGRDRSPHSLYYQQRVHIFVFRAGQKGALHGFLTALSRNHVGLQRKERLKRVVRRLSRADPRYFFHHFSASGADCFESTQLPGHYLACDGRNVMLKFLPFEKCRDTDSQVHFRVHYS